MYAILTKYKKRDRHTFSVYPDKGGVSLYIRVISEETFYNILDRCRAKNTFRIKELTNNEEKIVLEITEEKKAEKVTYSLNEEDKIGPKGMNG